MHRLFDRGNYLAIASHPRLAPPALRLGVWRFLGRLAAQAPNKDKDKASDILFQALQVANSMAPKR